MQNKYTKTKKFNRYLNKDYGTLITKRQKTSTTLSSVSNKVFQGIPTSPYFENG